MAKDYVCPLSNCNPLIIIFFADIEGCGLHCKDSKFTDNEHEQIQKLITYFALICIILNLFTVMTFLIDWRTANRYPAKGIFYVNLCFAISYIGYFLQIFGKLWFSYIIYWELKELNVTPGFGNRNSTRCLILGNNIKEDVVCKKDGTIRKSEPSAKENLSCVMVFFVVYYFLIAGLVWFMIFTYAWYMSSLQALGKLK